MTALILAGHGSHISPDTAGLVWSYVDQLRAWGIADEVTACFWKEAPGFNQVLDTVVADEIVVVPVFTARGYFTTQVIPSEMSLDGPVTCRAGRVIHCTRTLGEHPQAGSIVRKRVQSVLKNHHLAPEDVAVAIVGHGTGQAPASREAAQQQADALRDQQLAAEVIAAFLDDQPDIPSIFARTTAPVIIAVPFFLAPGSHAAADVPRALGLPVGADSASVRGRTVFYAAPIGIDQAVCHIILELTRDTGLPLDGHPTSDVWQGMPLAGADKLISAVQSQGSLRFAQLRLTEATVEPLSPPDPVTIIDHPAKLREKVRTSPFRPLATSNDLPGGWRVPVSDPHVLVAAVETIYPGAIADWASNQAGQFQPDTLEALASRQTGVFRTIDQTPPEIVAHNVEATCGTCVRHATWYHGTSPIDAIPCKAPCNVLLSRVKEAVA